MRLGLLTTPIPNTTLNPVDIGQGYMMNHIQTLNAASLWDKFTSAVPSEHATVSATT